MRLVLVVVHTESLVATKVVTFWIQFLRSQAGFQNTPEHYNFCDLGELLRQVVRVLQPDVAFDLLLSVK